MRINSPEYMGTRNILLVALCLLPIALEAAKQPEKWVQGTLIDYDSGLGIGIFLNGSPWTQPFVMLPGWKWRGGFGETLRRVFDPDRPVRFTFSKSIVYCGKRARVYEFSAPKDGLGSWQTSYQRFYPAYEGKVTITENDLMVVRLESKAKEFPLAFPISSVEDAMTWDWVIAGSGRELLPVSGEVLVVHANERRAYLVQVDYRNHRHFQATSNLTFDK